MTIGIGLSVANQSHSDEVRRVRHNETRPSISDENPDSDPRRQMRKSQIFANGQIVSVR
jgi:hypothetical protein